MPRLPGRNINKPSYIAVLMFWTAESVGENGLRFELVRKKVIMGFIDSIVCGWLAC